MKPKVIMHTQTSLDGRIKGFDNAEIYYSVANRIKSDMVLFGSNTVYTAFENYPAETEFDFIKPTICHDDNRPSGVIPDSRGILRNLHCLRNLGYLKDIIILVSRTTPQEYLNYLKERSYDYIVTGEEHVNYEKAFQILHDKYNCKVIRTDSGGVLTNVLLEQGLIDEISLVVSPCLIGANEKNLFESLLLKEKIQLELKNAEIIERNYLSLSYNILY
jgi:2,5-diamino-6-(ribosylamino)-4(3H)-pyrimidinone 5'-phosphate reductase